ncbi:MAG: hypothetical protein JWO31_1963, partial [Phycisphaerales bacterium]|nr:hypothetical protein [Phycisphaerales bacterium]
VLAACPAVLARPLPALGQAAPADPFAPAVGAATTPTVDLGPGPAELKGRRVESVLVRGNTQVSTAVIRNLIRTRAGDPYDPATVTEDYQRVYGLKKFANVEAKAEPTAAGGVNVVFVVTEQSQVRGIRFRGANRIDDATLRKTIELRDGEAIDSFRIALARSAVESAYKDANYPLVHVTVDEDVLAKDGVVQFDVVEGPQVRVRKINFKGAKSFTGDKLNDQIKSGTYLFIFKPGKYSPEQVEEDVAALRRFYEGKGFFDVRVGRKLVWSPDLTELQIDFVIEEGPRYTVEKVTFQRISGEAVGPAAALGVPEADLRTKLKLVEGVAYDGDLLQRDVREIVRAYSKKFGYIYFPGGTDPDYLRVEHKTVYRTQPGKLELVYQVHEGKEFRIGNIFVKGNNKSQDKLVTREFRELVPGERFNSAELQDAAERLRRLPFFGTVAVTPVGDEPGVRDLLVEVTEQRTASFNVGAGVNSNGGVGGNITYEQRNFDIGNWPAGVGDLFTERSFTGAGQTFRASFEPGTRQTSAYLRFSEPYLFDQPYGFSNELYLRTRIREGYDDRRIGDTATFSHRFTYETSAAIGLRGEQVKIHHIEDRALRAQEILEGEGKSTLTSVSATLRHDTTDPGLLPSRGTITTARWEGYGLLGGDYDFHKFTLGFEAYHAISEDLLDRKTILAFRGNAGYIAGDSVFFERFYGGGLGSIRGFEFRGVSPRQGRDEDPIGGDFMLTGSLELNFPLVGETFRGVVFSDAGTVQRDVRLGTFRASVGAGVRVILPFLGQAPLAIDFAIPVVKDDQDETQFISFSFGGNF